MKDLKRLEVTDSILFVKNKQIFNLNTIINKNEEEITLHKDMIVQKDKNINKLNLQLKISKKLTFIGVPGAFLLGYLIAK